MRVEADVRRLPGRLGREQLGHVRLLAARLSLLEERGGAVADEVGGLALYDAHTHVGANDPDGFTQTPEQLLHALAPARARGVVFPMHEPGGYRAANDFVIEAAAASEGAVVPYCRVDPRDYRHAHAPGDFELDRLRVTDVLVSVRQPGGFRPYSVSVFSADLPCLRKRWLFYDFLAADHVSGSFDGSLFTIHPRQTHSLLGGAQGHGGGDVGNLGGVEAEPDGWHDQPFSAELTLPPLAVCWFVPESTAKT